MRIILLINVECNIKTGIVILETILIAPKTISNYGENTILIINSHTYQHFWQIVLINDNLDLVLLMGNFYDIRFHSSRH